MSNIFFAQDGEVMYAYAIYNRNRRKEKTDMKSKTSDNSLPPTILQLYLKRESETSKVSMAWLSLARSTCLMP